MRYMQPFAVAASLALLSVNAPAVDSPGFSQAIPEGARFACPMETHPDQKAPEEQGAYFAEKPGECPWCGMKLKPLDELAWARARRAAEGADIAYTCPDHQHVFSKTAGTCPRCERELEPFKVMYTCPNPKHASEIHIRAGSCPKDERKLVPFRGVWLSEEMGARNVPANPQLADTAAYRCPVHPLVHSAEPGRCTICAADLAPAGATAPEQRAGIPADAKYVCPMQECNYFAAEPGRCPECGMQVKPIAEVEWARARLAAAEQQAQAMIPAGAEYVCPMEVCDHFAATPGQCPKCGMQVKPIAEVPWAQKLKQAPATQPSAGRYVCPMHPREHAREAQRCSICGMRLVPEEDLPQPKTAPEAVQVQMNHLMEHYLELQRRFAADRTHGAAQQALGLIAAADELQKLRSRSGVDLPDEFRDALVQLREAAVKIRGEDLAASRVAFVDLSAALRTLVEAARPSRERFESIYIFHCPMSKGDWLQDTKDKRNPYYGYEMLKCGELVGTK